MNRKKIVMATGLLIIFGSYKKSEAQDATKQTVYTLKQCIDIAIQNNPNVKSAEFQMQRDNAYLMQERGNMFPSLNAGITHNIANGKSINPYTNAYIDQQNKTASYSLSAGIVLWHGSSIQHFIKEYNLLYQAGQMDWKQAKDELTIQVILDYLAVLNEQEQLKQIKQQAAVDKEEVDRLTIENNKGNIAPSDLYDIKGQYSEDQLTILNTINTLELDNLSLTQLINIPYDANMQFQSIADTLVTAYNSTADEIFEYALKNMAVVKAADLHEKSALFGIKASKGSLLPTLTLGGSFYTNYSSAASTSQLLNTTFEQTNNYVLVNNIKSPVYDLISNYRDNKIPYGNQWKNNLNSSFSLSLFIPIFNGWQSRVNIRLAKINEQETRFQEKTVKIKLKQAVEQDFLNANTAYATYQKLKELVNDFSISFESAQVKFDIGSISSKEYMIAKNNISQAKTRLIAAKYNYILQKKILDYYGGSLSDF